jgi:uncharacterized beta-barrel protein YwiB (DUF1934 family)
MLKCIACGKTQESQKQHRCSHCGYPTYPLPYERSALLANECRRFLNDFFHLQISEQNLSYFRMENDENGMGETRTTLVFSKSRPWILTLTRSGVVRMTLSFEAGRHHIGTYHFGAMQRMISDRPNVMIASYARRVENRILEDGTLDLDYIVEVRGMDTQRTVFSLSIGELSLTPKGLLEPFDGGNPG